MKRENEDITSLDYKLMGEVISGIMAQAKRAQQYGEDMRSSRLLVLRDMAQHINYAINKIDNSEESK